MTHSVPFVCVAGELSLCLGRLPALEQHRAEASGEPAWGTGRLQLLSEEPGEVQGGHSEFFFWRQCRFWEGSYRVRAHKPICL